MQIKTPAKINSYLHILGRDQAGYHQLRLSFIPISLYDTLTLQPASKTGIALRIHSAQALGAAEDNLVYRAAAAFEARLGKALAVRITLRKSIPVGAGLGGGSGNAAGTLVALNALYRYPLSPPALRTLGRRLGADVPFFLHPVPSRGWGRGDRLSPLRDFPQLFLLVIKPSFSIPTAQAYARIRRYSPKGRATPLGSLAQVLAAMHNAFEEPLLGVYPALAKNREALLRSGALAALLSGSGSALFGVYRDATSRDAAQQELALKPSCQVLACQTLATHSYLP